MPRAKPIQNVAVIFRALIRVVDDQGNRRTRGFTLENTGKNLHFIGFAPLCGVAALPWLAPIKVNLNISFREGESRRAAIHDAADCESMTLTEGGHGKKFSKAIS